MCTKVFSGPEFVEVENEQIITKFYMKSRHFYKNCMVQSERNRLGLDFQLENKLIPDHLEENFFREEDIVPQF